MFRLRKCSYVRDRLCSKSLLVMDDCSIFRELEEPFDRGRPGLKSDCSVRMFGSKLSAIGIF